MRLINTSTLEFHEFYDGDIPPYSIVSHTWGTEEILYNDMLWLQEYRRVHESGTPTPKDVQKKEELPTEKPTGEAAGAQEGPNGKSPSKDEETCPDYADVEENSTDDQVAARVLRSKSGYKKILKIAEHSRVSQIGYFWIDTCCIDRSNSTEVCEAVVAAYRWFHEAAVCFIHLSDVPCDDPIFQSDSVFRRSWWFTRAWTLIELIAPTARVWFDQDWNFIFPDNRLITEITGIDAPYLNGEDFKAACVARRMAWASHRSSTRREDVSYSLMGLFDIVMPILYGEGPDKAFQRLQRKVLKATEDLSLFLWGYNAPITGNSTRLLAVSPDEFSGCRTLRRHPRIQHINDFLNLGAHCLELRCDVLQAKSSVKKLWYGDYGLVTSEFIDDLCPPLTASDIFIPCGTSRRLAHGDDIVSRQAHVNHEMIRVHRFPGTRPVLISKRARSQYSLLQRWGVSLRTDPSSGLRIPSLPTIRFSPSSQSQSTLPFRLVEIFPPHAYAAERGGFVTSPDGSLAGQVTSVFLRYEEMVAARRRFVVALIYKGTKMGPSSLEISSAGVHVVDFTGSNFISLCDEFMANNSKLGLKAWTRYLATVPVGNTLISTSLDYDLSGGAMRLKVWASHMDEARPGDGSVTPSGKRPFD